MVCFCIPPKQAGSRESVQFSVAGHPVLLAGSRHRIVPDELCQAIIQQFHHLGFRFYIGCAAGVDRCFRSALAESPYTTTASWPVPLPHGCANPEAWDCSPRWWSRPIFPSKQR